jgi:tetratricopeptide (TPR) repeat protein
VIFALAALCLICGAPTYAADQRGKSNQNGASPARELPAPIRPSNNELAARGFHELYNGDYDPAVRDFTELHNRYPDDPFPANYLLAAEIFRELSRIGALDTESYANDGFLDTKARRPLDQAVRKRILDLCARVERQCNARLDANPKDIDALYARGVARGFRATYMGMAEKSWMAAVRSAMGARRDHEHVLELDPGYVDAKMTVGIHLYIIGSLNWAARVAVALFGVSGSRSKGLEYLREVSVAHGTSSNEAAMALGLFLRREQRYDEALELVSRLAREYPRNFLLAVEYAHLLNAAGHGREAIAQYRTVLERGSAGKYSQFLPETAAWGLGVSLRGQREFEEAAEAFDRVAGIEDADPTLIDRATLAAGEMYDTLERREEAVARYKRVVARGRDNRYVAAARKHLRRPYVFKEETELRRLGNQEPKSKTPP